MKPLKAEEKLNIDALFDGLADYHPKRKGWHWREKKSDIKYGPFNYQECSEPLKQSVPLPAAKYFGNIDPQPDCVMTTEIASGRFEDDIRRMRMAAWHGADHLMVIRTAGQSHFDGLIEGTPEGVGGVPITRKQLRATRRALDLIEDEVGRPINFHSYVSGVAGPEVAVLLAEEGVNGAHQDPQYNILYRNINMYRSMVDAAEAKCVMASTSMAQIDGAHNANATAREAWKVMPELMVQHAINTEYSRMAGMANHNICLSTVPPTAPPAPCMRLDLPYAIALRHLFSEVKFRAQMNTKYMESCTREAAVTHTLNTMISRLTSADIQSTITPDEGRNVPWHYNNVHGINTAKQALVGMDNLRSYVKLDLEGELGDIVRALKERAVLFLEEILEVDGYFNAVGNGFFVDSGMYPERNGDGIARDQNGGIGVNTCFERDADYMAPVCSHFGNNNIPDKSKKSCYLIQGCTLCNPEKIKWIDELDPEDNVEMRLSAHREEHKKGLIRPEVQWDGDGIICITVCFPTDVRTAEFAAIAMAQKMGLEDVEAIHRQVLHPSEGSLIEIKGRVPFTIDPKDLVIPVMEETLEADEIREYVKKHNLTVVAATVGEDEHSVGLREIIDIKHGGVEGFGIKTHYLGTSVPADKLVDAAIELNADAIFASMIISHADIHRINMRRIDQLCREKGVRNKIILFSGGTQVTNEIAQEEGFDAGFGRGTKGIHVASAFVKKHRQLSGK